MKSGRTFYSGSAAALRARKEICGDDFVSRGKFVLRKKNSLLICPPVR
jgi:hypothetical protein